MDDPLVCMSMPYVNASNGCRTFISYHYRFDPKLILFSSSRRLVPLYVHFSSHLESMELDGRG